jgi:hypothetical protein
MRQGHREAQARFLELGDALGYRVRKTYSSRWPTDGVWFSRSTDPIVKPLPLVAAEVIVSEGAKTIRGSVGVLEAVSPSLGVLILQDDDIARRLWAAGLDDESVERHLDSTKAAIEEHIRSTRQRLEMWTYSQLVRRHELAMKSRSTRPGSRR